MIPAAYLRVYLPESEAGSWPPHVTGATRRLIVASDSFVWGEPAGNDAFVAEWKGRRYFCPRHPKLRMLEGALAFSSAHPSSRLLSEVTVEHIASELERLRSREPDARSHILTSPWHVPLRWFTPFRPKEREMYNAPDGHSIRYRTTVGDALPRVAKAVKAVKQAGFDEGIVEQIEDLENWLDEFSQIALLELDYARVASLFSGADLALDDSAELVLASLDALRRYDWPGNVRELAARVRSPSSRPSAGRRHRR